MLMKEDSFLELALAELFNVIYHAGQGEKKKNKILVSEYRFNKLDW